MSTRSLSKEKCRALARAWPKATSLADAHKRAGLKTTDVRTMNRNRRCAEETLGVELPTLNDKYASFWDIQAPSTLDMKQAKKKKSFVITSCTNDSPLVAGFLKAIEHFSEDKGAQPLVIPVRYASPNQSNKQQGLKWPKEIEPYTLLEDLPVGRKLVISSLRIPATSVNPLAGKQAIYGPRSAIYGHPQLALQSVGSPGKERPKEMMTTGSINRAKYSKTNDGGKADFHHTIYAVFVTVVRGQMHFIQLGWDGTGFCYGNEYWTENGLDSTSAVANIVHGDSHCLHEIAQISRAKLRIKAILAPEYQIWHDLHDGARGSHHETLRERAERLMKGQWSIAEEVRMSIDYINKMGHDTKNLIVGSNHHDHLDKWVENYKPKQDPANAVFHGWLVSRMYGTDRNALQTCFDEWGCETHYEFISRDEAYLINGVDVSQHGDKGVNGARGSLVGFAKTSYKVVIGHSHSHGIEKSAWQVGTSTDLMDYRQGYGTWNLTDCAIYENGKRALITYIGGKSIFDVVKPRQRS